MNVMLASPVQERTRLGDDELSRITEDMAKLRLKVDTSALLVLRRAVARWTGDALKMPVTEWRWAVEVDRRRAHGLGAGLVALRRAVARWTGNKLKMLVTEWRWTVELCKQDKMHLADEELLRAQAIALP